MDSFEISKIAAGVLLALLLVFGTKTAMQIAGGGHGGEHGVTNGYTLPEPKKVAAPAAGAAAPAAPTAAGVDFAKVVSAIAAAKPDNGKSIFKQCQACHTDDKGGTNRVGPNLWGVVGRKKAGHEGYNYSEAMKSKGGDWSYQDLAHFLHDPKAFVPGTKMGFKGVSDPADLSDVLAYLRTQADTPAPLPAQ